VSLPLHRPDTLPEDPLLAEIQRYWNEHIHDVQIAVHPVGTPEFFQELDEYRFDKLGYLPRLVDFSAYCGKELLEIGCGVGIDLVRFARAGAMVTGIDLAPSAIDLARQNFAQNELTAGLCVMNGEALEFADESFDVIYAHGVLQYTADIRRMICESHRVLRPGGEAILMVYNKHSWLNVLSKLMSVELEHQDAPAFRLYSTSEFRQLLKPFDRVRIIPDRFPVKTRLQRGLKAKLYNATFVGLFGLLPRPLVRPLGWHIMAFGVKT
jgi:ubiquinone/menaquinone biosynthesis C-methylase UbiE